jgi:hypothetical protein
MAMAPYDPSSGGVMLTQACPQLVEGLLVNLRNAGEQGIVDQLERVFVVAQDINGDSQNFSFMAYPVPRLSTAQRQLMELQERRSAVVDIDNGQVRIDLDDFGQINWFYVTKLPSTYKSLKSFVPGIARS